MAKALAAHLLEVFFRLSYYLFVYIFLIQYFFSLILFEGSRGRPSVEKETDRRGLRGELLILLSQLQVFIFYLAVSTDLWQNLKNVRVTYGYLLLLVNLVFFL